MAAQLGKWTIMLDGTSLPERSYIGGKAWSIARMRALGLPVPPAFVVTTDACRAFLEDSELPAGLTDELAHGMAALEVATGRKFGATTQPLLVAVRSGSAISMPGMMDTVLNLGITKAVQTALGEESSDVLFAAATHRRFREMYARIVLRAPPGADGQAIPDAEDIPSDPHDQLAAAVRAVFESWNSRRAKRYRGHHDIPDDMGTAVTIQAMVFGNLGARSGTGVLFSRNPLSGAPTPFGEYLATAQGEDLVSGSVTPLPLDALHTDMPEIHERLIAAAKLLEAENGDVQDIEFTVQQGELFLLQSRAAKRAPEAALRIAVDMAHDETITRDEALRRVNAEQVRALLCPKLRPGAADDAELLARGEAACQGVGAGLVVLDADTAEAEAAKGRDVILVRPTTSPEDVHGMLVARAVVTASGGATSHAAVVSRQLGLPCVVGCGDAILQSLAGSQVTVDGGSGSIFQGILAVDTPDERDDPRLIEFGAWAVDASPLTVFRSGEQPAGDILDLDHAPGGELVENLPELFKNTKAASGRALLSDAGVAAAVQAGLEFIVLPQTVPALLAACAAARENERM